MAASSYVRLALSPSPSRAEAGFHHPSWMKDAARRAADQIKVGEAPLGAPPGGTFRTVEVREVLASL
jgi:hypothetical protein